jgi:hypothetical protein
MKRITDRGFDGGSEYRWITLSRWINEKNWTQGVELGVWKGQTFKYLIENCPNLQLTGVDLYTPQPSNNGPEKWIKGENGHGWNHDTYYNNLVNFCEKNIRGSIIKDYTTNAALQFDDYSLNFVFIDADHSYEGVKKDIEAWLHKIKPGGYIIGHDIHFDTVKKAVTEFFDTSYKTADDFMWYVKL